MLKILNNIVLLIIKYDMCLNIEYNEAVILQNEFLSIKPVVRNFEANRQIFMMENSNLQKVISQLGSGS